MPKAKPGTHLVMLAIQRFFWTRKTSVEAFAKP